MCKNVQNDGDVIGIVDLSGVMHLQTTTFVAAHSCPDCETSGSFHLDAVSREAHVEYYRCKVCGHVWHVPKQGMTGTQTDVTQRRKPS